MVGIGIRYAIEMGLHRRWPENPSIDSELKKRAFWYLSFRLSMLSWTLTYRQVPDFT